MGKWIDHHWNNLDLHKITKQKVYDTIFTDVDSKISPWTRKTILKMVRRIFEMAVEDGIIDRNPCAGIRVNVPEVDQKVLTKTEVEIFLREAKQTNHRFYPVWAMALMTGMRSGELFALKWTDIDFEGRTISVSRQWTNKNGFGPTKTQRSRVAPISNALLKFLKELKINSERVCLAANARMGERRTGTDHARILRRNRDHARQVSRPQSNLYHQPIGAW